MRTVLGIIAGLMGALLALALFAVLTAVLLLQTDWGRSIVAERVEGAISGPGMVASIEGLGGAIPFTITIDRLTLADAEGSWLSVDDVRLAWNPWDLLSGVAHVDLIAAQRVALLRTPTPGEVPSEEEAPVSDEPPSFAPPELPVGVKVDRINVDEVVIGAPMLGKEARFTLTGQVDMREGHDATAALSIDRIDGGEGRIGLTATYRRDTASLAVDAEVEEPEAGFVAGLIGRPELDGLSASLVGEGPIVDWQGALEVDAPGLVRTAGTIALSVDGGYAAAVDLDGEVLLAADDPMGRLAAGAFDLLARVRWSTDEILTIETAALETGWATLAAEGTLDSGEDRVDVRAQGTIADLSRLEAVAGTPLAGRARFEVAATGRLVAPDTEVDLVLEDASAAGIALASAEASVTASPAGPITDPETAIAFRTTGRVTELQLPGAPLPPSLTEAVAWSAEGSATTAGAATLTELSVETDSATLAGSGAFDPETGEAAADLELAVSSLSPYRDVAGVALSGGAAATISATGAFETGAFDVTARADGSDFATGIPAVDALLGGSLDLAADAHRTADGDIVVPTLTLSGAAVSLTAAGSLDGRDESVDADVEIRLPRLARLAPAVGTELGGALTVTADLGGTLAALRAELRADGSGMSVAGTPLGDLALAVTASGLPAAPQGRLTLSASPSGTDAAIATDFAMSSEGETLALSDIRIAAFDGAIDGDLTADLAQGTVSGRLDGDLPALAPFGAFAGTELAGNGQFLITLDDRGGRQDAKLSAAFGSLAVSSGEAATEIDYATVDAMVTDLFGRPGGAAALLVTGIASGGTTVDSVNLTAEGDEGAFTFIALIDGSAVEPFSVVLAGDAMIGGGAETLTLSRLDLTFGTLTGALEQAARVRHEGETITVRDFALGIGEGSIRLDARYGPEALDGTLAIEDLPVAPLAQLAGQRNAAGLLNGEIVANGGAAPVVTASLTATGMRLQQSADYDIPPLDATITADWRDGRASAEAAISGVEGVSLSGRIAAPVVAPDGIASAALVPGGVLAGGVEADADLASLGVLLPIGGDRIAGQLSAQIAIDGTARDPQLSGQTTITDGYYENALAGTILRDINGVLEGRGEQLVVRSLRANDGAGGTLTVEGGMTFDPEQDFPFRFTLVTDEARLVRRDDADATVSAGIEFAGTQQAAAVNGRIAIRSAEINIPDKLPSGVATLDFEEINLPEGYEPPGRNEEEDEDEASPLPIELNLEVSVPGQIFVRGKGVDSVWKGSLTITGTASDPVIVGNLAIDRGTVSFISQTFTITRGVISFDGGRRIDPQLDLVAEDDTGEITVRVVVSGRASDPSIALESDPALPSDEILSRILFDTGTANLSAFQAVQLAQAAASLAGGGGGFNPIDSVRQALALDRLDVSQEGEDVSGTTLSAGKYITDDIYLSLDQGLTPGSSKVTVEVELTPNLTLESDVGANATGNVGLNWEWDY